MTTAEMMAKIGKHAFVTVEGQWRVPMIVQDAKQAYGRTRYQVSPVGGTGAAWVESSRVEFADPISK